MLDLNLRRGRHISRQRFNHLSQMECLEERRLLSVTSGPAQSNGSGESQSGLPIISERVEGANAIFTITSDYNTDSYDYTVFYRTSVPADGAALCTAEPGTDFTTAQGQFTVPHGGGASNPGPSVIYDVTVPILNTARDGKSFTLFVYQDNDNDDGTDSDTARFNQNPPAFFEPEDAGVPDDPDENNQLTVTLAAPKVDLNGAAAGVNFTVDWKNTGVVAIADSSATVTDDDSDKLSSMTATIVNPSPGDVLAFNAAGTSITGNFAGGVLTLSGLDTVAHYQQVLRSITYNNTQNNPQDRVTETVNVEVNDGALKSTVVTTTINMPPKLSIEDAMAREGQQGDDSVQMEFVLTLDRASTSPVVVHYSTEDGDAIDGIDYTQKSGNVTFAPGATTRTIQIQILSDTEEDPQPEPDKTFTIQLSNPNNAKLTSDHATGTIQDAETDSDVVPNSDDGDDCGCGNESSDLTGSGDASAETGDLTMNQPLVAGPLSDEAEAVYQSDDNPHPIISVKEPIPDAGNNLVAYSAAVTLQFGTLPSTTQYYSSTTGLVAGTPVRFAQEVDATTLATGTYLWTMTVIYHFDAQSGSGSPLNDTVIYKGEQSVVNHINSPYGNRWWIRGVDQAYISDGEGQPLGVTYVSGDGQAAFYAFEALNTFQTPHGHYGTLTIAPNDDIVLTDPQGNVRTISAANNLLSSVKSVNGNTTAYQYWSDNTLKSISDQAGHTVLFNYTGGLLSSVADAAGHVTNVQIAANGTLTSVTAPPPINGGTPIVTTMTYDATTKLINQMSKTTAGIAVTTNYGFNSTTRRLDFIQHASDNSQYSIVPAAVYGLVASGQGTSGNPAPFVTNTDRVAIITDELHHTATEVVNSHGLVLSYTDFNGNTTTYTRDLNGRILTKTEPDPDGPGPSGPLGQPVTTYTYDSNGNITDIVYPDLTSEHWTFDPVLNVMTSHTDQLLHQTVYGIDHTTGDVLSVHTVGTGPTDTTTTYTYTPPTSPSSPLPAGLVLTELDPLNILTTYEYWTTPGNYFGKAKKITYAVGTPDEAYVQFEYDANGNLSASYDEMNRKTTYSYDAQNQLIQMMAPSPDGYYTGAVTSWSYDGSGRLLSMTDANGTTTYTYDANGRLWKTTLPQPTDGVTVNTTTTNTYDSKGNLKTVTDPMGRVTQYDYDNMGRVATITEPDPDGNPNTPAPMTVYTYDNVGNRATMTDADGNLTTYKYDIMNRLIQTILPSAGGSGLNPGASKYQSYYDTGWLKTSTDQLGHVTTYNYDSLGREIETDLPAPNPAQPTVFPKLLTGYDKDGNIISTTDALNNTTTYGYDYRNRQTSVTYPDPDDNGPGNNGPLPSPVTRTVYNKAGQVTDTRDALYDPAGDPLLHTTSYVYDGTGRQISITLPKPDANTARPGISMTYDALGNVLTRTDAMGYVTSYEYDHWNRLVMTTQPDPDDNGPGNNGPLASPVTTTEYDTDNEITKVTDPLGHATLYGYDGAGRQTTITLPDPDDNGPGNNGPLLSPVTTMTYDAVGNLLTVADQLQTTMTYAYDHLNRRYIQNRSYLDATGNRVTDFSLSFYDDDDNLTGYVDALRSITYQYDGLGRQTQVVSSDTANGQSPTTNSTYDLNGNLLTQSDDLNETTAYSYDHLNRQVQVVQPNGDTVKYGYDAAGRRTSLTDGAQNQTTFGYDNLNRLTSETNTLNQVRSYSYDANGNRIQEVDRDGRVNNYFFDHLNRKVEEDWVDSNTVTRAMYFGYDAAGNLLTASDPAASYTYTYDALNRQSTATASNIDPLTPTVTLTSGYDGNNNRTSLSANAGGTADFSNSYSYDGLNQLYRLQQTSVAGGNSVADKKVTFAYDDIDNHMVGMSRYNSLTSSTPIATTQYDYAGTGQIHQLTNQHGAASPTVYTIGYDAANRVTSVQDSSAPSQTSTYGYDYAGQLTSQTGAATASYTYDHNGNRTNTGYTTGPDNRVTSDGTYTYTYDAEGNLVTRTLPNQIVSVMTYDHRNRLVEIVDHQWNATGPVVQDVNISYDVFDRRVKESVTTYHTDGGEGNSTTQTTTTTQEFIYDGDHVVLDFTAGTGAVPSHRYLYGNAVDQVLAQEDTSAGLVTSGRVSWFLDDYLGSTRDLIDNVGNIKTHYTYDAFGKVLTGDTSATRFLFTGRELDTATGLQYNRERWYYSQLGRWTSEDPLGFDAGDANLYRYVNNSPTNVTDPTGLVDWTQHGAILALLDLKTLWVQSGYTLAPALLQDFLLEDASEHDMSQYSAQLSNSQKYRWELQRYVEHLAEQYPNGTHTLPNSQNPFEVEYLRFSDINWLHPYNSAGDLAYAVGTAHFRYANASLTVSRQCPEGETVLTATFKAQMTMYDSFAFWPDPFRTFFYYYEAGVYLQEVDGFLPVKWHMTWQESISVKFTIPRID